MKLVFSIFLAACSVVSSQNSFSYWQQHVDYNMSVDMNVANWQYTGTQKLVYTNHSPYLDTILDNDNAGHTTDTQLDTQLLVDMVGCIDQSEDSID